MTQDTGKTQRTSQRSSGARAATAPKRDASPAAALIDIADTLYRTAAASCVEHRRYADLVERAASDVEQRSARASVRSCDEALDEVVDLYELACLEESNHADDAWWHRSNMVWRAAKEYLQHHASSDKLTRGSGGHGRAELMELTIEYKLEASALLRLRHTVESYKSARPEVSEVS
jgi:hypothetical protein